MDPDVAQMLADLGNARRDVLSAPEERTGYGRTSGEEHKILLEAENRRANAHLQAKSEGEAVTLKAWNNAATFGGDEVAEQMENRFSGQGHRARLQETVPGMHGHEGDNGHGFSRRPRTDFARDQAHRQAYQQSRQTMANVPGPGSARQRPPSPRLMGRTRFLNDQRVPVAGVMAAASSIPTSAFTFSPQPPVTASSTSLPRPPMPESGQATAVATPWSSEASAPAALAAVPAPLPSAHLQPSHHALPAATTPTAPAPAARTRAVPANVVATTSSGSRRPALSVSSGTSREASGTLRQTGVINSIFQRLGQKNASATVILPRQTVAAEMVSEGLCTTPEPFGQDAFQDSRAAAEQSEAPRSAAVSQPVNTPTPDTIALANPLPVTAWQGLSAAPLIKKHKMWALADAVDEHKHFHNWDAADPHYLSEARRVIAEDLVILAQPHYSEKADQYFATHRDRRWLRPFADQARLGTINSSVNHPMVIEIVKVTHDFFGKPKNQPDPVAGRPPTPPSTASNSRAASVAGNESTDASSPLQCEPAKGILGATFYDQDGNCRGNHQWPISTPVQATVTVTAKDGKFDVQAMADNMEILANVMNRRSRVREQHGLQLPQEGRNFDGH